jgi:hypothetical protein
MASLTSSLTKVRRDTTANWLSANPIIPDGQLAIEETTSGSRLLKIGDGATTWSSLPYVNEIVSGAVPYQVGDFWTAPPWFGNTSTINTTAGTLYAVRIPIPGGSPSLKTLTCGFGSPSTGPLLVGVYSDVDGYPETLLGQVSMAAGPFTSDVVPLVNPIPASMWPAGIWIVFLSPTTVAGPVGPVYGNVLPTNGRGEYGGGSSGTWTAALVAAGYTVLPATFPAGATVVAAAGSGGGVPSAWCGF